MEKKSNKSLKERLAVANQKIDVQLPDLWLQAEQNLEKLEEDYHKNQINKGIRD
ncbi:hypothetical protein AB4Z50_25890 [Paenibacillus sp. 2TAB26]|uniref:hypothetical protein n=1 Tax=Paenibacillus sp. 2TAB26 TaxID=3233005 RepID=UPI003F95F3A5